MDTRRAPRFLHACRGVCVQKYSMCKASGREVSSRKALP